MAEWNDIQDYTRNQPSDRQRHQKPKATDGAQHQLARVARAHRKLTDQSIILDSLIACREHREWLDQKERQLIKVAKQRGPAHLTWEQIGGALGITKQAAQQRWTAWVQRVGRQQELK